MKWEIRNWKWGNGNGNGSGRQHYNPYLASYSELAMEASGAINHLYLFTWAQFLQVDLYSGSWSYCAFLHCLSLKCLIIVSVYSAYLADLVVSVLIYIIDYVTGTGRGIGNSSREQYIRAYNARTPEQSVSHSHRHMAELLQLEHALGGKLQHLHRWFWDRHVHRASQEACGESVCTILYYRAFSLTS